LLIVALFLLTGSLKVFSLLHTQDALDLPLLRSVKSLTVTWSTLTLLAGMPQLQLISAGSLTVRDNALMTNVSLPGLVRVSASVTLQRNGALLGVSLPVGPVSLLCCLWLLTRLLACLM
jgi:hypothetical protein